MVRNAYGTTSLSRCPFCQKTALVKNKLGLNVCKDHTNAEIPDLKCICKESMELKEGKFGPFCICRRCGIMNLKKALEVNKINMTQPVTSKEEIQSTTSKKEIIVDEKNAHLFGV